MDIPHDLNIGPVTYSIEAVDEKGSDDLKNGDYLGRALHGEERIVLNNAMSPVKMRAVLLHEMVHAAGNLGGFDVSENLADALAFQLLLMIKGSPNIFEWIAE